MSRVNEHGLTPQQETFAAEVAAGKTQSDAYRVAYPRSLNWALKTVHSRASEMMASGKVAGRVRAMQAEASKSLGLTVEDVLRDIDAIKRDAMLVAADKDGRQTMTNHQAALKAAELQGKYLQMWVDRIAMTIDQIPDEELDGRIADLSAKAGVARVTH